MSSNNEAKIVEYGDRLFLYRGPYMVAVAGPNQHYTPGTYQISMTANGVLGTEIHVIVESREAARREFEAVIEALGGTPMEKIDISKFDWKGVN